MTTESRCSTREAIGITIASGEQQLVRTTWNNEPYSETPTGIFTLVTRGRFFDVDVKI